MNLIFFFRSLKDAAHLPAASDLKVANIWINGSSSCGYNDYLKVHFRLFCKNNHEKNEKGRKKKIVQKAFDFNYH